MFLIGMYFGMLLSLSSSQWWCRLVDILVRAFFQFLPSVSARRAAADHPVSTIVSTLLSVQTRHVVNSSSPSSTFFFTAPSTPPSDPKLWDQVFTLHWTWRTRAPRKLINNFFFWRSVTIPPFIATKYIYICKYLCVQECRQIERKREKFSGRPTSSVQRSSEKSFVRSIDRAN